MLLGGRPVKWILLRVVTINMGPVLVECLLPQAILCTAGVPPAKKVHEGIIQLVSCSVKTSLKAGLTVPKKEYPGALPRASKGSWSIGPAMHAFSSMSDAP